MSFSSRSVGPRSTPGFSPREPKDFAGEAITDLEEIIELLEKEEGVEK